ncbi:hypothetical protein HPB50_020844 [Hyalomma asiaticum]|uniref:Uncharacterized protein n=1 Tax=Hyalomma asiaticum TaxID=266040 RepID=A0ACB7RWQ0_HYAAI|nr:hypothetical protein HPB50_020844 [Hyalomma asiaticum]
MLANPRIGRVSRTDRIEDVSARGNVNHETANEAARGFTYRAAQPADSTEEWWCEAKDRITEYSEVLTRAQDYVPASSGPDPKRGGDIPATADWVATYAGAHEAQSEGGKDSDDDPAMAYGRRRKRPPGKAVMDRPVDFGCPRKAAPERNRQVPATTPAQ